VTETAYPTGRPNWVELLAHQHEAAMAFYAALFGWKYEVGPTETGNYALAKVGALVVAGIGRPPAGAPVWTPAFWTMYLATADADDTAERITKAGGTLLVPPSDVGAGSRMAIAEDPTGAVFGIMQGGDHSGVELTGMHGTMCWHELVTRDAGKATDFYRRVFGFGLETLDDPDNDYTFLKVEGRLAAGLMQMPPGSPENVPSHWTTAFAVVDVDAACRDAEDAGGRVIRRPVTSPFGRHALVEDPFGGMFAMITPPKR
jgi:predicted enzyme related to lactoylglutathione lyase